MEDDYREFVTVAHKLLRAIEEEVPSEYRQGPLMQSAISAALRAVIGEDPLETTGVFPVMNKGYSEAN